jgi:L-alanine-DL-glutamate epimerase-like enolase superfamily enzyme
MRERFIPRILEADPESLVDATGNNLDPHKIWSCMFTNEKPGGHGERSVAIGTIDMAVWDAVAKIEGTPLFQLLADRYGDGKANRKIRVCRRRLLLPRPGSRETERRDAQLHRSWLHGRQEEDRRRIAG